MDKNDTQRIDLFGGYHLARGVQPGWGMYDPKDNWMHSALCCTWSDRTAYNFMSALSAHVESHVAMWKRIADDEKTAKDGAYNERNKLVRLLASLYPSGIKKTDIPGWDEEWHWCVYVDLPTGQASWHIHISEYPQFANLPEYKGQWDKHSTEEKYARIARLAKAPTNEQ